MNASEQVYRVLKASQALRRITVTVRPMRLAEHDTLPAVVYSVISTDPGNTLCGGSGWDLSRVQIDAWAMDYPLAHDMGAMIRAAMTSNAPLVDNPATPLDYMRAQFIDGQSMYDDDTKRYRWSSDFYIWQHWSN